MKRIWIGMVLLAVLCAGCGSKHADETEAPETTAPVWTEQTTAPEETEAVPGVETTPVQWQEETTAPETEETEPPATESTKPKETTPPATTPKETVPPETKPKETVPPETSRPPETEPSQPEQIGYEQYLAMSGEEQQEFIDSFPSIEAFMAWREAAKKEYEDKSTGIGDGIIDVDKITGGNT